MKTFLFSLIVFISTSLAIQGATPPEASPVPGPTLPELSSDAPVYLALGDSLAYGVGASDPQSTGYVPLLHQILQGTMPTGTDLQVANLSTETGGTTTSLLELQMPLAMELIQTRNGDDNPANDVVAITIDIGANDAFRPLQEVCAAGLSDECTQAITEVFTTVSQNLGMALGQLRAAAGPDVPIVAMTYPNTLVACEMQAAAPAADLVLEGTPDGSMPGLNDIIRQVAAQTNVQVAEVNGLIGPEDLVGDSDCKHTNDAGHEKIADAFAAVILDSPATPAASPVAMVGAIRR